MDIKEMQNSWRKSLIVRFQYKNNMCTSQINIWLTFPAEYKILQRTIAF